MKRAGDAVVDAELRGVDNCNGVSGEDSWRISELVISGGGACIHVRCVLWLEGGGIV